MIFKIAGIKIKISFLFAAGLCLILGSQKNENLAFVIFFSLLHEAAHLLSLLSFGEKPRGINLGIFGMEIRRAGNVRLSYGEECVTAMAGPCMNLFIALLIYIITRISKNGLPIYPIAVNLSIAGLNLLPIMPLDGGRALHFFLCKKSSQERAAHISNAAAICTLFPLALLGFTVLIRSGYNFSLLAVCIYLSAFFLLQKRNG